MAMVNKNGQTGIDIKVNGLMTKCTDKVYLNMLMEIDIKENGKMA
jgi:uncharacterized protein YpuA (DUF1002 family)